MTLSLSGPALAKEKNPARASTEGRKHRFEDLDTNKDGKITEAEAGKRWKRMAKADANKDGAVVKEEAKAFRKAHKGERKAAEPTKPTEPTT